MTENVERLFPDAVRKVTPTWILTDPYLARIATKITEHLKQGLPLTYVALAKGLMGLQGPSVPNDAIHEVTVSMRHIHDARCDVLEVVRHQHGYDLVAVDPGGRPTNSEDHAIGFAPRVKGEKEPLTDAELAHQAQHHGQIAAAEAQRRAVDRACQAITSSRSSDTPTE